MSERPILFSAPMVRAILAGRKTCTRRTITRLAGIGPVAEFRRTDTPGFDWICRDRRMLWHDLKHADVLQRCPYGRPSDRLWVRESCAFFDPAQMEIADDHRYVREADEDHEAVIYRADEWVILGDPLPWTPSIHMPRWASRIDLEISSVGIEPLHRMDDTDARAEGVEDLEAFRALWDELNGVGSWQRGSWVWVIEFERLGRGEGAR